MNNNSPFLNRIGLGNLDLGYMMFAVIRISVVMVVLFIIVMNQAREIKSLRARFKRLVNGKDGESLESEIAYLIKDHKSLRQVVDLSKKDIEALFHRMRFTIQKSALIKFDAFQQMGGQLSFCLVLLDQEDNGYIINSVHSTEGSYCYTKEVKNGVSDTDLGKEEAEALAQAIGNN